MAITYTDFLPIATAISAYAEERYTKARLLTSTGLTSDDAAISTTAEGFTGQLRWHRQIVTEVNTVSLTDPTPGVYSSLSTALAQYIKNVKAVGIKQVNMQEVITKQDSIARFGENLNTARNEVESEAIRHIMFGVASSEARRGPGITDWDEAAPAGRGAFIDLNAAGAFGDEVAAAADGRKLIDPERQGAARGEQLFRAVGMAWKDYEPDYAYLIIGPEMLADLRSANILDSDRVTDGQLTFQTIFDGKYRLILTRSSMGDFSDEANVNDQSTKTSFVVKPGSIVFKTMPVEVPTEMFRDPKSYYGGGTTELWHRFGFVAHPTGYDWTGPVNQFPTMAAYANGANWSRKFDPLNLGIIPIFHS